jgi:hypothetical protein
MVATKKRIIICPLKYTKGDIQYKNNPEEQYNMKTTPRSHTI